MHVQPQGGAGPLWDWQLVLLPRRVRPAHNPQRNRERRVRRLAWEQRQRPPAKRMSRRPRPAATHPGGAGGWSDSRASSSQVVSSRSKRPEIKATWAGWTAYRRGAARIDQARRSARPCNRRASRPTRPALRACRFTWPCSVVFPLRISCNTNRPHNLFRAAWLP